MIFTNKKGTLEAYIEMMSAPLVIIFLILLSAIFIFFVTQFNDRIQLTEVPTGAKDISNSITQVNNDKLRYIPALALIGLFILTIALIWFSDGDIRDPVFIMSFFIYMFYTLIIGAFKLFYEIVSETGIVSVFLASVPLIPTYMEYLFFFQVGWFFLLFLIWGLKQ